MASLQTRGGSLLTKGGKLLTSCDCCPTCGELLCYDVYEVRWYCYDIPFLTAPDWDLVAYAGTTCANQLFIINNNPDDVPGNGAIIPFTVGPDTWQFISASPSPFQTFLYGYYTASDHNCNPSAPCDCTPQDGQPMHQTSATPGTPDVTPVCDP